MTNPLLSYDDLPPFSLIRPEHLESAVDAVLAENRARIQALTAGGRTPTWNDFVKRSNRWTNACTTCGRRRATCTG